MIIDLTLPVQERVDSQNTATLKELELRSEGIAYTGMIYEFRFHSMVGTYVDFPGHIKETDDGFDALNYPAERLYRIPTSVIHLERQDGSGGVGAAELEQAYRGNGEEEAIIINALGEKRFDEIEERSVYLSKGALRWLIDKNIHLLISDIYESQQLHGVFYDLFQAGISTVCYPVNLHKIKTDLVRTSVFCVRMKNVTQLPCRIIAEE